MNVLRDLNKTLITTKKVQESAKEMTNENATMLDGCEAECLKCCEA